MKHIIIIIFVTMQDLNDENEANLAQIDNEKPITLHSNN